MGAIVVQSVALENLKGDLFHVHRVIIRGLEQAIEPEEGFTAGYREGVRYSLDHVPGKSNHGAHLYSAVSSCAP
jgi:hypothetical protein